MVVLSNLVIPMRGIDNLYGSTKMLIKKGNIFDCQSEALVAPSNSKGIANHGIAHMFKKNFPYGYTVYKDACDANDVTPGKLYPVEVSNKNPKHIIYFPTRATPEENCASYIIESGLEELLSVIEEKQLRAVGMPAIGCGTGGLSWVEFIKLVDKILGNLDDCNIVVYHTSPLSFRRSVDTYKKSSLDSIYSI